MTTPRIEVREAHPALWCTVCRQNNVRCAATHMVDAEDRPQLHTICAACLRAALAAVEEKPDGERTRLEIVRDVLTLVDGYLATQHAHTLTTDGAGVLTWAELREHLAGALSMLPGDVPLTEEAS